MSVGTFISGIIGGKTADIVDSITNTVDTFVDTKGEKAERDLKIHEIVTKHMEAIASDATKNVEMYLADTANAREMNSKIQGEKPSWLARNVGYIIDLFLTSLWGTVTVILFLKVFKLAAAQVDMISLMALHGTVTAVFMTVVNFHRGTSKGSEVKTAAMVKAMK